MTGHPEGCYTSVAVRFAKPGDEPPGVIALAAGAIAGVLSDCLAQRCHPDDLISVAIGPCLALVGLWEKVSVNGPQGARSVAASDQVEATLRHEPGLFAALAFAHVSPDPAP